MMLLLGTRRHLLGNLLTTSGYISSIKVNWSRGGSNPLPPACKAGVLPSELRPHIDLRIIAYPYFLVRHRHSCYTGYVVFQSVLAMNYETIIGLEVHAQLLTRSKMYCGCSSDYANAPPNTHVCPVCLGMPGVLPVINRQAAENTIMTAL